MNLVAAGAWIVGNGLFMLSSGRNKALRRAGFLA